MITRGRIYLRGKFNRFIIKDIIQNWKKSIDLTKA